MVAIICFLWLINLAFVFLIYPSVVKSKCKQVSGVKKICGEKYRVSKIRYFCNIVNCLFFACGILDMVWGNFKYSNSIDYKGISVCGILIAVELFKILFIYPRSYIMFDKDKICYHNGFVKKEIDGVWGISFAETFISYRTFYWKLMLQNKICNETIINLLLFERPEEIYSIIRGMTGKIHKKKA